MWRILVIQFRIRIVGVPCERGIKPLVYTTTDIIIIIIIIIIAF